MVTSAILYPSEKKGAHLSAILKAFEKLGKSSTYFVAWGAIKCRRTALFRVSVLGTETGAITLSALDGASQHTCYSSSSYSRTGIPRTIQSHNHTVLLGTTVFGALCAESGYSKKQDTFCAILLFL